jgi:membrane protein DedA with SNARE-associated domain
MAIIEILGPIVQYITSFISNLGYVGIFLLMILESALIPIPSEIIMPFSGFLVSSGKLNVLSVILAGSIGNLVGSIITYYIGFKAGRALILKYGKYVLLSKKHLDVTEQLFKKYGDKISFIGRLLPAIRTYVSLPAGIGETNLKRFVIYTFAGSMIWNSLLTYAGMKLASNWKNIEKYSIYLDIAAILFIAAFVIWFVYKVKRSPRISSDSDTKQT